jgi:hypothetical protein
LSLNTKLGIRFFDIYLSNTGLGKIYAKILPAEKNFPKKEKKRDRGGGGRGGGVPGRGGPYAEYIFAKGIKDVPSPETSLE